MSEPTRPRVRVLPAAVVAKIAAGETIERPTSVLKELVENALDARATHVAIRIEEGIDRLLEVSDDGTGMTSAEVELALERHATSKIQEHDDLFRLSTLGFRGEALPAIAAVSRLTLLTSTGGADEAVQVDVVAGEVTRRRPASRLRGTTVTVRDLFFNVPVRRKFMKTERGELRAALRLLSQMALAMPRVRFTLERLGSVSLAYEPARDLRARAIDVYGPDTTSRMLDVARTGVEPSVEGLIGSPEQARATRDFQVLIVNGRVVVSPLLSHAIRMGYGDLLAGDRHPMAVLVIGVDPGFVDANVHPTKREVRFAHEGVVFEAVRAAVSDALGALSPADHPSAADRVQEGPAGDGLPFVPGVWPPDDGQLLLDPGARASPAGVDLSGFRDDERPARVQEPKLWQLHRRYIFAQVGSGLLIIDQHAAHERILYERALLRLDGGGGAAQQMLLPKPIELTPSELELLEELLPELEKLGFEIEPFGGRSVVVRALPSDVHRTNHETLIVDLLDEYAQGGRAVREVRERLARAYACRAAIKSGALLGPEEMRALIDALFSTTKPHGDPHGRPTLVQTSLEELDRRFGRA